MPISKTTALGLLLGTTSVATVTTVVVKNNQNQKTSDLQEQDRVESEDTSVEEITTPPEDSTAAVPAPAEKIPEEKTSLQIAQEEVLK